MAPQVHHSKTALQPEHGSEKGFPLPLQVLLVDDVQENLELLEDVLVEHGYATLQAKNGVEALELLKQHDVHLIVADAMMPKMDGFMLCKEVRASTRWGKLPFVIYTANYVDAAEQEFARSIGVDRYVVKYAGLGALVQAVNELAGQRYGRPEVGPAPAADQEVIDDQAFLEQHHAIVIKKLEEKMAELELYAETLRKKNQEIQASEDRYRGLFENASVAIFVIDRETGRVLDVNPKGVSLLGYSREELSALGRLPFEDPEFQAKMLHVHTFISVESSIRTKTDGAIAVEVGFGPMTVSQDHRLLLYVRDVSEQRRMREQMLQVEKMTLMGRLAAGIAHEIRNPLAAITLNLQYLVHQLASSAQLRESAQDALEGAKRVDAVIENTLNLARITPTVMKPERINDLVLESIRFLKIAVRQKEIAIETALGTDIPPVMADAKQLQQVILNIVQNAIDASTPKGVIRISTAVRRLAKGEHGAAVVALSVRDFGPGITHEQQKHLFEQFYTTKIGGTGLGLALSKQIIEKHNGDICIEPALERGTVVDILLPAHGSEGGR